MFRIKYIVIAFVIILFCSFILYVFKLNNTGVEEFKNKEYIGVIDEIRRLEGKRGLSDIKIKNNWVSLDVLDSKIMSYIKVNDSVVKKSGSETITIYRKNKDGVWGEKVFK